MQIRKWTSLLGLLLLVGCGSSYQAPIGQSGEPLFLNSGRQHLVNEGETLYAIAWMYDLDPNKLARANNLDPSDTVAPGQKLLVDLRNFSDRAPVSAPAASSRGAVTGTAVATARAAQGLGGLQRTALPDSDGAAAPSRAPLPESDSASRPTRTALPSSEGAVATASSAAASTAASAVGDALKPAATKAAGAVAATAVTATAAAPKAAASAFSGTGDINWAWPYRGNIVARFSEGGADTKGIDIAGKEGDAVLAAADGEVVYAGSGLLRYGNLLIIKHNDKYLSAYAHNKVLLVSEKAKVTKGQKIAEVGVSGGIDKPQLHFEIRVDGKPADPLSFLPSQK